MGRRVLWSMMLGVLVGCAGTPTEGESAAAGAQPEILLLEAGSYGGGRVWRSELRIDSVTGRFTYQRRGSMANTPDGVEASRSRVLAASDVTELYRATRTGAFRALRADYSSQPTPPDGGGFLLTVTGNERQRTISASGLYTLPPVLDAYLAMTREFTR